MKKVLYLASLVALLAGRSAQAQITLEHKYSQQVQVFKLSTGDVKYAGFFPGTTNQVRVYNQDHSVFRLITIPALANTPYGYVEYLSDHLFNATAGLEFMLYYNGPAPASVNKAQVFDESGASLFLADSSSYVDIRNTPLGTKLITYQQTASGGSYSKVYSLPGSLVALKTTSATTATEALPYPNPALESITLPYTVPAGQVSTLIITDETGRIVKSSRVDSTFGSLLLDTRQFRPGIYLYRVTGNGPATEARRFTVQH